jgi:hypothetical protein
MRTTALPLFLLVLATGCAHATIRQAPNLESHPPQSIVVMPTDPGMGPPEAALFVRDTVAEALARQGYQVIPFAEVDKRIAADASPADVLAAVQADAVMYTRVTRYDVAKDMFNTRTTFGLSFNMNDPAGGELWVAAWTVAADSAYQGPRSNSAFGAVAHAVVDAANAAEAAKRPPFLDVATEAIYKSISELPDGPLAR